MNQSFWRGKRVLVTGHTGFKGSWLSFWLHKMGARVLGFALKPETSPNLFDVLALDEKVDSITGDIRDLSSLRSEVLAFDPDVIFHLAAKAIVRASYEDPLATFQTNVIGTANLLEVARSVKSLKAFVSVTSDKCYENNEWVWKYRETDPMGGWDPYSASKGCAELVTASYRRSFFQNQTHHRPFPGIATARAGNVIGGGDWSRDRLIPDIMRSIAGGQPVMIRNPHSIRPWQYILDLLHGYLLLAEKLYHDPDGFAKPWNFGPLETDEQSVGNITGILVKHWGQDATWILDEGENPHEANYLKLDSSKARAKLGWESKLNLDEALHSLTIWYKKYYQGEDMVQFTDSQINEFERYLNIGNSMSRRRELCNS